MSRLLTIAFNGDLSKLKQEFARRPESARDQDVFCQAVGWDKTQIVAEFLANGANPNSQDRNCNHPLSMICHGNASLQTLEALLAAGSDPVAVPELPFDAASNARIEVIQRLWEIGVDFSKVNRKGLSPLAFAASMGREDVVDFLLQKRVSTEGIDISTPIQPWKGSFASKEVLERIRAKIRDAKI